MNEFLWSDESLFTLHPKLNPHNDVLWINDDIKNDESIIDKFYYQKDKKCQGVLVWGCMSASGLSKLVFFDENTRITSNQYCDIVLNQFVYDLEHRTRKTRKPTTTQLVRNIENYCFQQDGAPIHTSSVTQETCDELFPSFIKKHEWPGFKYIIIDYF